MNSLSHTHDKAVPRPLSEQDECEVYLFGQYLSTLREGSDVRDAYRFVYGQDPLAPESANATK